MQNAVHRLARERGFAVTAIVTLGLGIGANTAIFSLVSAVLLRPLPYGAPDRLVMIWNPADEGARTWLSAQEVMSYRREAGSLEQCAAYTETNANLTGGQEPERLRAAAVTANLFETLGVSALLGRTFVAADDEPGSNDAVVLGHGVWQRRFGGAPDVIGRSLQINGRARTVVGVMPASFRLPLDFREERPTEVWMPLGLDANLGQWGNRSLIGVGRMRQGVPPASATAEFRRIGEGWIRAGFVRDQGDGRLFRTAIPVQRFVTGGVRGPLLMLFGAVGFVLLIACANVANLLLASAQARRREVAVRAALGATRGWLIRQLLTESVVLSLLGGAFGIAAAWAGTRLLTALGPANLPRVREVGMDAGVLVFTAGVALGTGILFGLAPAIQLSRSNLTRLLHEAGRSATRGPGRLALRRGLVIFEMAFSVVLLLGAGLLIRSLVELQRVELGFDPQNVLTGRLQLPLTDYPQPADVVNFYRQLDRDLEQIPGVRSAGAVRILPLTGIIGDWSITIEGRPRAPQENPNGDWQVVTPGYFTALGLELVRGRFLTREDREEAPPAVVINDTMAERYWPGEDAIGKRFRMGTGEQPWLTVVGITRTVRHNAVIEAPRAEMYLPHAQLPIEGSAPRGMTFVVKTEAHPLTSAAPVREAVRALDPNLPLSDIRSMERVTADALSQPRFTAVLLGLFAALALALATVGVYGIVSLLVAERAHEIAIRLALGAQRGTILGMVVRQGILLAAAGVGLGLAAGFCLTRFLESLVYGVATLDPLTFAVVPALLVSVALLACLRPALGAAALEPVATLRRG